MGGHALKHYTTQRINQSQYEYLEEKVRFHIEYLFGANSFLPIKYYSSKSDFGDMDFLLITDQSDWKNRIIEHFNLAKTQYHSNGPVLSIGLDNFQIDIIHHKPEIARFAQYYYSFQDLGNLLGRIFHKMGMKLGHDGLWLVVRSKYSENQILDNILLSRDWDRVLDILGLDQEKYQNGFHDLVDIFEYVISSKWFDPDIYLLHNRNHTSRVRDRKRTTYRGFLKYIENRSGNYNFITPNTRGGHGIREPFYSQVIVPEFPWVVSCLEHLYEQCRINHEFKKVYNGGILMELTGLHGAELGKFMSQFEWDYQSKSRAIDNPQIIFDLVTQKL